MKKTLLLTALCLLGLGAASPGSLTPAQALARLDKSSVWKSRGKAAPTKQLKLVAEMPQVYVFSSGEGFAVTPANDCAPALLGYADEGTPDVEGNPTLKWWLSEYSRQIAAAVRQGRPLRRVTAFPDRAPIEPLCPFYYNQGAPFNDSCPMLDGRRCVTGCVATAMCIMMRYHKWPVTGLGVHSYHWRDTTLTFDYAATTFQWQDMPESYDRESTEAQRAAVAQLMYAAGVSVDMFFHPGESAAYINYVEPALRRNFNYSRSMWSPARNYYDLEEWNTILYGELAAGRPILYFGDGSDGGHEFVCDGYSQDGYFHINWGWGGISNGYFTFIDLDPPALGIGGGDGGFDFQQGALLGIRPPQDGDTPHFIMYCGGFVAEKMAVATGEDLMFTGRYFNRSGEKFPEGSAYGIKIEPLNGEPATYAVSADISGLLSNHSENGMKVALPSLPNGSYRISPAYKTDSVWQRIPSPVNANASYVAVVESDSVFLTDPGVPHLSGGNITMDTPLVWHRNFRCHLPVENRGYGAFSGTIRPQLLTTDSLKVVANGAELVIAVPAQDTITARFDGSLTLHTKLPAPKPQPGEYFLRFINSGSHQQIGDTIRVNLYEPSDSLAYTVGDLALEGGADVSDPEDVHFTATVDCTSGYFAQQLQVVIYRKDRRREEQLRSAKSGTVYLVGGQTGQGSVHFNLTTLDPGEYQARCFVSHRAETPFLDFTIDRPTGVLAIAEPDSDVRMYDLQGNPLQTPPDGEVYICNGHKYIGSSIPEK